MRFTVEYENGAWFFEVVSTGNEPSHNETFEIDDFDEAVEVAAELIDEIRSTADPLADLFDEDE